MRTSFRVLYALALTLAITSLGQPVVATSALTVLKVLSVRVPHVYVNWGPYYATDTKLHSWIEATDTLQQYCDSVVTYATPVPYPDPDKDDYSPIPLAVRRLPTGARVYILASYSIRCEAKDIVGALQVVKLKVEDTRFSLNGHILWTEADELTLQPPSDLQCCSLPRPEATMYQPHRVEVGATPVQTEPRQRPTASRANVTESGAKAAAAPTSAAAMTVHAPNADLRLEVASTEAQREQGLTGRASIPAHTGMLFVFDKDGPKSFWTKNMRVPVDIIFISADGAVRIVFANVPPIPGAVPDRATPRESGSAQYVIVLAGGEAAADGITVGTKLKV